MGKFALTCDGLKVKIIKIQGEIEKLEIILEALTKRDSELCERIRATELQAAKYRKHATDYEEMAKKKEKKEKDHKKNRNIAAGAALYSCAVGTILAPVTGTCIQVYLLKCFIGVNKIASTVIVIFTDITHFYYRIVIGYLKSNTNRDIKFNVYYMERKYDELEK